MRYETYLNVRYETYIAIAGVIGMLCGIVSAFTLFAGSWTALIFWGVVGLALGFSGAKHSQIWAGIAYGALLSLSFIMFVFRGSPEKIPGLLLLALVLGVIGAICGIVLLWIGQQLSRFFLA